MSFSVAKGFDYMFADYSRICHATTSEMIMTYKQKILLISVVVDR